MFWRNSHSIRCSDVDFCNQSENERQDSEALMAILKYVAKSGDSQTYKWHQLRQLITFKVHQLGKIVPKLKEGQEDSMQQLGDNSSTTTNSSNILTHPIAERVMRHLQLLDKEPPFTLQRICELLINPQVYPTERTLWNLERCTKGITISIESFKEQNRMTDESSPIGISDSMEQQFDAMIDEEQ
eukprot:CAMPEP_0117456202 /NCGR_PEP_ID=MMETSP0759-20121206/11756_1 /TAXON_ID=63605 /ORGANISM="Percolomonas cosmopolitus, Strain WS" /LENGTH=184 /DNA_ID=CAMNT_0005249535 /DNA_START=45 /DNA_END=599 /DNA_ORIENTATION=+